MSNKFKHEQGKEFLKRKPILDCVVITRARATQMV